MHVGALRIANETLSLSRQPPLVVTPEMLGIRFGVPFPSVTVCILHIEIVSCAKDLNPTNALHFVTIVFRECTRKLWFQIFINGLEVKQNWLSGMFVMLTWPLEILPPSW